MSKHADITFRNELDALDRGTIKKLQVAYLDTFLVSPFDGVITGVFCSRGDYVGAGQPVIQ